LLTDAILREVIHQPNLSRTDILLLCLAVGADNPKQVKEIQRLAIDAGVLGVKKWNISIILSRTEGWAIRIKDGWVLSRDGKAYVSEIAKGFIDIVPPQAENISPHELLARRFEQWQKEYFDRVNIHFSQQNEERGNTAFLSWEQRFFSFLLKEAPSLVQNYVDNVRKRARTRYTGQTVSNSWKNYKGDAVEAFLVQAIEDSRFGHVASESAQPISVVSSSMDKTPTGKKIFIGHGGSQAWKDLRELLEYRLHLDWDEFNREPTAGITTVNRLEDMLTEASFAFLVMTAEDEHSDGSLHARENVIHEAGLFQGKLGFKKAILLLEDGCKTFSNVHGLTYIPFPPGNIKAISEEIRRVLEREGLLRK
jgi:predicted nucleotide-binding protein